MKLVFIACLALLIACSSTQHTEKVITTESGLKYMDHVIGEGDLVSSNDYITVDYKGWLVHNDSDSNLFTDWNTDLTKEKDVFDESYAKNRPYAFTCGVGKVIKGWDEGLLGMRIGGKRTLIIPPELGYGNRGSGKIKPNSTLKFIVEVRNIDRFSMEDVSNGNGDKLKNGDEVLFHYKVYSKANTNDIRVNTKAKIKVGDEKNNYIFKQLIKGANIGTKRKGSIPGREPLVIEFEVLKLAESVKMWDLKDAVSKTTKSGLQYIIVKKGDGPKVTGEKKIRAHYSGFLGDGTMFDSSVQRDEPLEFDISRVIKGWTEGLKLLNVGSKARFIIPPELGYGSQASGPIPANSTLIFDVEVLGLIE